jgi:hypothetical protein
MSVIKGRVSFLSIETERDAREWRGHGQRRVFRLLFVFDRLLVSGQFQLSEYPSEYKRVYSALVLYSEPAYNGQVSQKICSAFYIWYTSGGSDTKPKKNRLYDDNYLKYGFTVMANKPQCVICGEVLSRESMKPSKLNRHLLSKHPKEADKPLDFFERKGKTLNQQQTTMTQVITYSIL